MRSPIALPRIRQNSSEFHGVEKRSLATLACTWDCHSEDLDIGLAEKRPWLARDG